MGRSPPPRQEWAQDVNQEHFKPVSHPLSVPATLFHLLAPFPPRTGWEQQQLVPEGSQAAACRQSYVSGVGEEEKTANKQQPGKDDVYLGK